MQELLTLLDENLVYDGHEMIDGNFVIRAHSGSPVCKCRYCGRESSSVHSLYQRSVQDLPIQGHTTTLVITARKMFCKNPKCNHKTFSETFSFMEKNAKKTNRLKDQIINVALETSSIAAADTLKREAIQTSKSTVCLLLKKSLPVWITDRITELCVDDFALRKGSTYGTILIDSRSHRVIDLIPSRERKDVAEKLAEYPNLKVVSRDGSPAYAAAISSANPEILQISDRFHLLKGLTEACRYILQGLFKANIAIQKPEGPAGKTSEYNSSYWEKETKKDAPERTHEKNLARKTEAVEEIRRLSAEGLGISEIMRETGKSYATVKKYLQKEYNPENAGYGRKQPSKLKPYEARIKEMLKHKCSFKEIERAIREEGYDGAASTIRMYATRERRLIKQASGNREMDIMERRWVVKLLYKPMEKVEGLDKGLLERLLEEYPIVQDIYDLVGSFREILFSKKGEDLDAWLEEADRLGLDEIKSFANGLRRDLEAVKNAASHDYNNGLAEGSVNKLKLVKRKMYGRCSFETLRKKMLLQEYYKISQQT